MDPFYVIAAVDVSRVADTFARSQLPNIVLVGREVDLLERMRRNSRNIVLDKKIVSFHATDLSIEGSQFETSLEAFSDFKMIFLSQDNVTLRYNDTKSVYKYGHERLQQMCSEAELAIVDFISQSMRRPQNIDVLDDLIDKFEQIFRKGLRNFIFNNILRNIDYDSDKLLISPRAYREEETFKQAVEILEAEKLGDVISTLQVNPGMPSSEVSRRVSIDLDTIGFLSKAGIVDPLNLNVGGDAKSYLFGANLMNKRSDYDHLDLVKMTLANFRYGEHYSSGTQLYSLKKFFKAMLRDGYAGDAYPIGTDYHNLEVAGIVKVEKLPHGKFRFWMLKKDVIKDACDVLEGYTPFQIGQRITSLSNIDDVVTTRSGIKVSITNTTKELAEALREIEKGIV